MNCDSCSSMEDLLQLFYGRTLHTDYKGFTAHISWTNLQTKANTDQIIIQKSTLKMLFSYHEHY